METSIFKILEKELVGKKIKLSKGHKTIYTIKTLSAISGGEIRSDEYILDTYVDVSLLLTCATPKRNIVKEK